MAGDLRDEMTGLVMLELERMVRDGLLEQTGPDTFRWTEKGRKDSGS